MPLKDKAEPSKTPISMPTIAELVGQNVKRIREERGMRQSDVSDLAVRNGIPWTRSVIASMEHGGRRLTVEDLYFVIEVLDVSIDQLFAGADYLLVEQSRHESVSFPTAALLQSLRGGFPMSPRSAGPERADPLIEMLEQLKAERQLTRSSSTDDGGLLSVEDSLQFFLPGLEIPSVREMLADSKSWYRLLTVASVMDAPTPVLFELLRMAFENPIREAEVKAARRLGVPPLELVAVTNTLWGADLTTARDARVQNDPAIEYADPRSVQALRGAVTRVLLDLLESTYVEALGPDWHDPETWESVAVGLLTDDQIWERLVEEARDGSR